MLATLLFEPAFTTWGVATSWLELVAVLLAFACVWYNVLENPVGWPLAFASCVLYTWLFAHNKLYGDSMVQVYFALAALWAWWQWLHGKRTGAAGQAAALRIARLTSRARWRIVVVWLLLWPAFGHLLARFTDSDVPYLDGFTTAGSVVGQILLGRKLIENWPVWLIVNLASIVLLSYKSLYLSALLYGVFVVMALAGWRRWRANLTSQTGF